MTCLVVSITLADLILGGAVVEGGEREGCVRLCVTGGLEVGGAAGKPLGVCGCGSGR